MNGLRTAHIGCGYWGKNLARNFAELGVLAAVVDAHQPTVEKMAEQTGARVATFAEVLADPSIDAVSFATLAESHFSVAMQALKAGKHVFVEKPLALDPAEAETLIATAAAADRRLMVGHLLQYHPVFIKLREMVAGGAIGSLRYVYSNRQSLGKFRVEEDVLWSFAPHDVSMILALAGAECTSVSAQGAVVVTPGIADWALAQLQFANGLRAHIQVSWLHPFKEQRLVAIGDQGMLVFEDSAADWADKLKLYRHKIDRSGPVPVPAAAQAERIEVERSEPLRAECQHFLDAISAGTAPRTDGCEGLAVLKVLHAASACLAAGQ